MRRTGLPTFLVECQVQAVVQTLDLRTLVQQKTAWIGDFAQFAGGFPQTFQGDETGGKIGTTVAVDNFHADAYELEV